MDRFRSMLLGLVIILAISFTMLNQTGNFTEDSCPVIDGGGRAYDLLDRGWCDTLSSEILR